MKASPLLISWHNDNAPIYSVHFDPNGKGRLATAGKYVLLQLERVVILADNTSVVTITCEYVRPRCPAFPELLSDKP